MVPTSVVVAAIYIRKFGELDLREKTENIDFMSAPNHPHQSLRISKPQPIKP
jgi:hypothetical protein